MTRIRSCSICGEIGHDRRSCSHPIPLDIPVRKPFDPWLHYEWEEHHQAMKLVRENPDGMTLEEIGEILEITRERVRQIETAALAKLKGGEEAGAGLVVEMKGRLTTYAFALVACEDCGEYFIRDGAASLCSNCQPDPIPQNMPCLSLREKALRKLGKLRDVSKQGDNSRSIVRARRSMFEGFFNCFDDEEEDE